MEVNELFKHRSITSCMRASYDTITVSYTHLDVYKRHFLHRGCPTKDLPNNRNERKGYAYS